MRKYETFKRAILSLYADGNAPDDQSAITRYYEGIRTASKLLDSHSSHSEQDVLFEPAVKVPALSEELVGYYDVAKLQLRSLGEYKGRRLKLLNLMLDKSTNTVKTLASLMIVARAVHHIRHTGENVYIVTPTSGNKGVALRSAVERALALKLVDREQLRIAILLPENSLDKLRESDLSQDKELAGLNPVIIYSGADSSQLKELVVRFQRAYFDEFSRKNIKIWQTLHPANYLYADSVRAFYEYEHLLLDTPRADSNIKLHIHAVSSGFGFLGYQMGRNTLMQERLANVEDNPGYFLIQHLATPDMVLHLQTGGFDRTNVPQYIFDKSVGLYTQHQSLYFPQWTLDAAEVLEPTFYTTTPKTAEQVSVLVQRFGGGGLVVSLLECLERYAFARQMLQDADIAVAPDPRKVTEWATIMAITGALNAVDRELIPREAELTIHATGYYATMLDYLPLCTHNLPRVSANTPLEKLKSLVIGT